MANRYATKSGNWSDTATWDGGTTLPGVADTVRPNSYTVTIDQDVEVLEIRNTVLGGIAGYGMFEISSVTGTRTIIADRIEGGNSTQALKSTSTTGTIVITADIITMVGLVNAGSAPMTVNAYVVGGAGANQGGMQHNHVSASTTINGNVSGGGASGSYGIYCALGGIVVINGDVTTGNSVNSYGINIFGPVSVTVTGNVYGGVATHGIYSTNASAIIDINGSINAHMGGNGAYLVGPTNVQVTGPFYNAQNGRAAIAATGMMLAAGQTTEWHCTDDSSIQLGGEKVVLTNTVSNCPAASNVRSGQVYGPTANLTGTLAVPTASQVALGVAVDNTTGTASMSATQAWEHEISSGVQAKDRLNTTITDAMIAAQLAVV